MSKIAPLRYLEKIQTVVPPHRCFWRNVWPAALSSVIFLEPRPTQPGELHAGSEVHALHGVWRKTDLFWKSDMKLRYWDAKRPRMLFILVLNLCVAPGCLLERFRAKNKKSSFLQAEILHFVSRAEPRLPGGVPLFSPKRPPA